MIVARQALERENLELKQQLLDLQEKLVELEGRGAGVADGAPMTGGNELRAQKKLLRGYKAVRAQGEAPVGTAVCIHRWLSECFSNMFTRSFFLQVTGLDLRITDDATIACRLAGAGANRGRALGFELELDEEEGVLEYVPTGACASLNDFSGPPWLQF